MPDTNNNEINRFTALQVFSDIAKKYPVSSWQIEGMDIWPIFKILIVFNISSKKLWNQKKNDPSLLKKVSNKLSRLLTPKPSIKTTKLQKTDLLFVAAQSHDVQFKGRKFNRFFEPLIEGITQHTTYLQYCDTENSAFDKRYYNQCAYASAYNNTPASKSKEQWWAQFQQLPFAQEVMNWLDKELQFQPQDITRMVHNCQGIGKMASNMKTLLEELQPRMVFLLNYYGPKGLAFVHAAHQLGIPSVDMQHGPQVMGNSGYANWEEIPATGYNVLPNLFWVWDEQSKENIDHWANKTATHKALLGGNPWCDFWKGQLEHVETKDNSILYSLQPITTKELFPDYLIDFIQTETKYEWRLRYHPRQAADQIAEIESLLKQHGIFNRVTIEDAVNTPLPLSIVKSRIGVTNFSGVAIESADFGIPVIILHHLGEIAFSNLIKQEKAVYLKDTTQLKQVVQQLINQPIGETNNTRISQQVFDQLIIQQNINPTR